MAAPQSKSDFSRTTPEQASRGSLKDEIVKLMTSLQGSLDIQELIETFSGDIKPLVEHSSALYYNAPRDIRVELGSKALNWCEYHIVIEDESLGYITFTRRRKFSKEDTATIEMLLSALIYPLRNALLYRDALSLAYQDPLTGVRNRSSLDVAAAREVELAKRYESQFSMLMIDVDHFKKVNDNHGHSTGDHVLKHLAKIMGETIRSSDMLFRYGGEEFVILLHKTSIDGAFLLGNRIREIVEKKEVSFQGNRIRSTVSIGIAAFEPKDTVESLFNKADSALYCAKEAGRNTVQCYQKAFESVEVRHALS